MLDGKLSSRISSLQGRIDELQQHVSDTEPQDEVLAEGLEGLSIGVEELANTLEEVTERQHTEDTLRKALQEARHREAEISELLEGSRAVLRYREFEVAARSIFDSCKRLTGATAGYVALLSEDGAENDILFLDSGGAPCTVDPTLPMPTRGLREKAYHSGKTVYENDFTQTEWTKFLPEGHAGLDNVLFAPLVVKGITVGLLGLANKPGGFNENDARLASAFGELAAIALFNSRALESLESSEERFRSVAQTATEAIITIDSHGNIVFWNKAATTIFGYTHDEVVGKPLTFIIPKRFRVAHLNGIERVVSTGKSQILGKTVEMAGLRRDGSEFPVEVSLSTWRTREDAFFTGIIHDITKRKRAEEEIHSLARFPNENRNPVLRVSQDGTILYANQASEPLLGLWASQVGQKLPDTYHQLAADAISSGVGRTIEVANGERIFSVDLAPVEEAGYVNLYGRDISERKRAEEEIRSLARFPNENRNPVLRVSQDGTILYANEASAPLLTVWACQVGQKLPDTWRQLAADAISSGAGRTIEVASEERIFSVDLAPVEEADYVNLYGRDITEQVQAESQRDATLEALRERTHELGERVKELNCLYGISALVEKPGISLAEILQGTVDLVPPSWQYPEVTGARVILKGREFRTENFRETATWQQSADIIVNGQRIGTVEVCYLEERPESDEGPFLKEERSLVNAIAERLGETIDRVQAEEALRQSEKKYRQLIESAQEGVWTIDSDAKTTLVNPRMAEILGYTVEEMQGKHLFSFMDERGVEICERNLERRRQGIKEQHDFEFLRKDGTRIYTSMETSPITDENENYVGALALVADITERRRAEALLREQNEFITTVFESLGHPFYVINANDYTFKMANSATYVGELPETVTCYALTHRRTTPCGDADNLCPMEEIKKTEKPAVVEHIHYDQEGNRKVFEVRGHPIFDDAGKVTQIIEYTLDVSDRKQTEEALRQRTNELSTLLEISRHVALTLELEPLLGTVLDHLKAVVDYDGATISSLEGEGLTALAYRGPIPQEDASQLRFSLENTFIGRQLILDQEPVIIPDVRHDSPLATDFREVVGERFPTIYGEVRSWMGVPLTIKDRVMGILALQHNEPDRYRPRQADLVLAFANQAAVAIENARLYEQAQVLAALEERQRLARDLHDAVSQTLFSASLSAEVLPQLWERNRIEGRRCLEEIHHLTRSALAEMRTLLLELRPETLVETGLSELLRQLTEAIGRRARVPVSVTAEQLCPVPPEVQVALYRISQEALNNVAKHAEASRAEVYLRPVAKGEQKRGLELRISDDGHGFDVERVAPDSLGLGIMHERAEAIGAELRIESQIGQGTQVVVVWPGEV